jgi:hypothetical protein
MGYSSKFDSLLYDLKRDGRYRTIIDLERQVGTSPTAIWRRPDGTERLVTVFRSATFMKERFNVTIRRRHLLGLAIAGVGAAAVSTMVSDRAAVKPDDPRDKRRARYQANSPEVRNFYRVNSYPRP